MDEIKRITLIFDQDKLGQLQDDYTLFHPSPFQMKIIYDLADIISTKLEIKKITARIVIIKGIVDYQQVYKRFHFQNEGNIPQIKMKKSSEILDHVSDLLTSCLKDTSIKHHEVIKSTIQEVFEEYLSKYAGREIKYSEEFD